LVGSIEPDLRPTLLRQYYWWSDPADADGVEGLHFASAQRRLRIAGRSLQKFERVVMPFLDGQHTVQQVIEAVASEFAAADIVASLRILAEQRVLDLVPAGAPNVGPTDAFFHELGADAEGVSERLARATVAVFGLSGAGGEAAVRLAASGVGTVRLIDDGSVTLGDAALSPLLALGDGSSRTDRVASLAASFGATVQTHSASLADADVRALTRGVDFVVCALDAGWAWLMYKLNRVCLAERVPWTVGTLAGAEVILGPTIRPHETACFTCYRMRAIACAATPEDEMALERVRDGRKHDDSVSRENLAFGAGMLGNLLGLEALKVLSGVVAPSALGSIIVTDLVRVTTSRHVVLRQPSCPDCFPVSDRP
jgi:adenylyltransferase/sulfurtransferase